MRQGPRLLLAVLALSLSGPGARGAPVEEVFAFDKDDSLRLELVLKEDRTLEGRVYRAADDTQVARVVGSNPSPGSIRLSFLDASIPVPPPDAEYRRFQEVGSAQYFWRARRPQGTLDGFINCAPPDRCPEMTDFEARLTSHFSLNVASQAEDIYRFAQAPDLRIKMVLHADRRISGRVVDVRDGKEVATITGENSAAGMLSLSYHSTSDAVPSSTVSYRFIESAPPDFTRRKHPFQSGSYWQGSGGPPVLEAMTTCYPQVCPEAEEDPEFERFDSVAGWEGNLFDHAVRLVQKDAATRVEARRAAAVLRRFFPVRLEWQRGDTARRGFADLQVPPGLEQEAAKILKARGFRGFAVGIYPRGSELLAATFKAGTFVGEIPTKANQGDLIAAARERCRAEFTALGFATTVQKAQTGGLSFVVTLVMHSDKKLDNGSALLEALPGVWIKTRVQLVLSSRSEKGVPDGRVDIVQMHVIGSKIYRAPPDHAVTPQTRWHSFGQDTRGLDDDELDNKLNWNILDALTTRLKGAFSDMS